MSLKTFFLIAALITGAGVAMLLVLALMSRSGKAPGLVDGKLSPCPATPNCVCSEYTDDERHYIEPLRLPASGGFAGESNVLAAVNEAGGTLQAVDGNYVAATFSSTLFGFVDDVEIRVDPGKRLVHFRSASRVGYSDGGVNRTRVERLKTLIKAGADAPAD